MRLCSSLFSWHDSPVNLGFWVWCTDDITLWQWGTGSNLCSHHLLNKSCLLKNQALGKLDKNETFVPRTELCAREKALNRIRGKGVTARRPLWINKSSGFIKKHHRDYLKKIRWLKFLLCVDDCKSQPSPKCSLTASARLQRSSLEVTFNLLHNNNELVVLLNIWCTGQLYCGTFHISLKGKVATFHVHYNY